MQEAKDILQGNRFCCPINQPSSSKTKQIKLDERGRGGSRKSRGEQHVRILRDTGLFRTETSEDALEKHPQRRGDRRAAGLRDPARGGPSGFGSGSA